MIGEVDTDGTATLRSGDLGDFDATVALTIEGDAVSGMTIFLGEEPIAPHRSPPIRNIQYVTGKIQ